MLLWDEKDDPAGMNMWITKFCADKGVNLYELFECLGNNGRITFFSVHETTMSQSLMLG